MCKASRDWLINLKITDLETKKEPIIPLKSLEAQLTEDLFNSKEWEVYIKKIDQEIFSYLLNQPCNNILPEIVAVEHFYCNVVIEVKAE